MSYSQNEWHEPEHISEFQPELTAIKESLAGVISPTPAESPGYLVNQGGKKLRPLLVLYSAGFGSCALPQVLPLATAMELLHLATLTHDDIIDNSVFRRGRKTLNYKYSNQVAVLTGDYYFSQCLRLLAQYPQDIIFQTAGISLELVQGELLQVENRFNPDLTPGDYFWQVERKTARFLAQCCRLGALIAGCPAATQDMLYRFGYCLGTAYQIQDDIIDFMSNPTGSGKKTGNDLEEGLLTLPVIYTLKKSPHQLILRKIILSQKISTGNIKLIQKEAETSGAVADVLKTLNYYIIEAERTLNQLKPLPCLHKLRLISRYLFLPLKMPAYVAEIDKKH